MGNTSMVITPEIRALIEETVEATLARIKTESVKGGYIDYFAAMEKLLYAYPALKALVADKESYLEVEYHQRSKDIVKATSGESGTAEHDPLGELREQRRRSYERTREKFEELDGVIRQFRNNKKFHVIRMYYFNEDVHGNPRDADKRITWEDVAWELSEIGIVIDERQVRRWKNEMIRAMMVVMWPESAIYAATHQPRNRKGEEDAE